MNNDYKAYKANHSSMSSNKPIAKRILQKMNNSTFQQNSNNNRFIQGNRNPYINNENNSPYQINSYYPRNPYNIRQELYQYEDEIVRGYYINEREEQRYKNENGGEDDEIEIEENQDYIERDENGEQNEGFIGDSEFVRNDMSNNNNNYSPNQNGQDIYAYYNLRNINNNSNNNKKREYNYEPQENPEEIEQEENVEYIIQSPQQIQDNFSRTNYNLNYKKNQKGNNKDNLRDSASSEAYANESVSRATLTDYKNTGIYTRPKITYNNNKKINNGISTEERGIESLKGNPKIIREEESPIYNYPESQREIKGGKVDLNISLNKIKNMKKNNKKEEYDMKYYEKNIDKVIKIQATLRYFRIKEVMDKYHKYDEFIFLISKVQFNHFYDNFYFFINQLFNVYKANTLGGLKLENQEEKSDQEEKNEEEENNEESVEEENDEENEENNNKSYEHLLNDYKNLKKKYNALRRNNLNNNNNNLNNNNSKSSFKKLNQELASLQGETTFGSIRTDTNKFHKFKANLLNNNNSTSNIKDNLTISNYNEDEKYERHFYTPDHYDDDDSFNDVKDNRYSYSSIHSDENSKYFDNEQPRRRFKSFNINKIKGISLNKGNVKNKVFEYSPTIEIDKQSRGNNSQRNNNINESQNDKINNISAININKSALDEQEDIFDRKKIEEMTYEKYIINYSKDLRIVKNNKIILKSDEQRLNKKLPQELIIKENENIELKAKEKTEEEKMKEIFDNKKLLEKMKLKLEKENEKKYRHNNIIEERTTVPNIDIRYKLLKNLKKTKENNITINKEKREKILKESNENNFEIKSEYYYIETKDSALPEIIEKKIKESNIINQKIIQKESEFKQNKTILSSETNFNIEAKKKNIFEDIESNELSIISKQKKLKKRNEIKRNEEIKINSEPKKWNISTDLNLISNEEFSLNKKEKIKGNKNKENELYIENNELQIVNVIRKNKNKDKIENNNLNKKFDIIIPTQNKEILINKQIKEKEKEKEEKAYQLFKCNENTINIKQVKKPKFREIKITTKKILKHEKIIRSKKFLKNELTSENSIFINGTRSKNNNWNEDKLIPSKKDEFLIKRKKHEKEKEIFSEMKIEGLDKINIEEKNPDLIDNYINKLKEKENENKKYFIDSSNQIQIKSKNKILKKFKNLNIGKAKENEINIENNDEENINILRAKKIEKDKKEVKPNLIEQFTFGGIKKSEKKIFNNLDIKKCEGQFIKATKKEQKNLEKISNSELIIEKQKIEKKEMETQIEQNLINNNLIVNNDIKYRINPLKKEENIIVKNNNINIKHKKPKSNIDLIIVKQKKLNLINSSKKFDKENIEPCYSESICIKTREEYEDPLPNFKLSKKFNKLLISDNDNIIPQNNINLINELSTTKENQFEIIGNKNELNINNIQNDEYIQLKPLIEIKNNNNEDLEKNMTKQFINSMVQNKFEIEKKKNMDNTKNKLVTIIKTNKMKNALNRNIKNKKYFFDKLKNIKTAKKILSISNSFNHNYLSNVINKLEEYTDTVDLKNKYGNELYIDNNALEIRKKNNLKKNKLLSEIKENEINIESNKKNNIIEKVDEEIQMSPKKELKKTTKKIIKKEKEQKTKKYVDTQTQTPKLRPVRIIKNGYITYEINRTFDMSYLAKANNEENDISLKVEKEDIKDKNKIYRINKFNEFFKYYFNKNSKKIPFLRLLYLTKWIHLTKNSELNKSKSRDFKNLSKKYYSLVAHRFSDFSEKYKKIKAINYLMNLFNRRKKEVIKTIKMKKKGNENDAVLLRKNKNALHKLNKVLRQYCGKYVFSLYKKNKK